MTGKIINFTLWPTCQHSNLIVDRSLKNATCGKCKKELDLMYIVEQMADKESRLRNTIKELEEEIEKSKSKMRCKCEHCKKMTRIGR